MSKNLTKIKAIETINTFSQKEKSEFKKFLTSPYFNTNGNIIKLYNLILKNEKKISSNDITEKELYLKVFSTTKYSYSTMRNLMSSLFKLSCEFLIINDSKDNPEHQFESNIKLLHQYSVRFLDSNFNLLFKKTDNDLDYTYLGSKYFKYKYELSYVYSNYEWMRNNTVKRRDSLYDACLNNICSVVSVISEDLYIQDYLKKTFSFKPKLSPAESLLNNLNLNKFLEDLKSMDDMRYSYIYNEIKFIKLLLHPGDFENYYTLKKIIFANIDNYSNSEKYYHTSRLFNFVINKIQKDSSKMVSEISGIRKFQLKNIVYGKDGVDSLPMRIFIDMIDTFLITEDFKFVESFISDNLKKVEFVHRENALNYAMARLELKKNNFEKSIIHLSKLNLTEPFLKLTSKMLIIQAYYELNNLESGMYALDSLKHFIKNNQGINSSMKSRFNFLIKIIEKIYKIRVNPDKFSLFDIEKLILDNSKLYSSNETWYLKKIEELRLFYTDKRKLKQAL